MRRFSIFIVPFLCAVFVFIFLVGTIFSARADYSTANFQGVAEEATETETEEPSPTASPTSTVEQLSSSTPTNTETESTPTVTSSPTSTPEPSLTPSPLPIDTLTPTPTAPQLPQNLSTTQRSFFHYPYSRPPAGFRPKTGDSTRPPLQAVASSWGNTDMDTNGKLNQPYDVDTDAYGNVYVADAQNRRIKVYNPNGTLIRQWGEWGWEEGNFEHPVLISLDKLNDYVYVFDDWRNQLSKFNLTGDFIDRWDIDGDWVTALAISPSDQNPYIAVHKNDGFRIQILNKNDGGIIDEFGPMIDGFTFEAISDIAIDTNGNIYISDESVGIIIKYNQTFEYQGLLGDSNNTCWWEENTFCGTISLAIDGSNNIYAIDYTHRVQKFDSSLNYQSEFGSHGSGNGQFNFARGITVSNSGYIYVTDTFNHRIQKFTSSGTYLTQWGSNLTPNGLLNNPQGIAVNSNGVYIADTYNHRVQKFSHTGVFQAKWGSQGYGSYGNNPFLYTRVPDVAFDSANNIYLIDQWANRIIKTNPNGSLIRYYGREDGDSYGDGELQFREPWSIALDNNNNLFIAERDNHRIQVIGNDNSFIRFIEFTWDWCTNEGIGSEFTIAIDSARDYLYVFDSNQNRVLQYDISNIYNVDPAAPSYVWGRSDCSWGPGPYEFSHPVSGAVDSQGRLYVADRWNSSIKVFDPTTHSFLGKWGEGGRGFGQFLELTDVAVDPNGYVYALDKANGYRVQRFEPFFVAAPPPKPTLISPSGTITNTFIPTYRWKTTPGAFRYAFRIDGGEEKIFSPYPYCNADACGIQIFTPLPAGTHSWQVRAANNNGIWGEWSNPMTFTISPNYPSNLLGLWGWSDSESGKRMNWVFDLAVDQTNGVLYASDAWVAKIYKFDLEGNILLTFGSCCGNGDGWMLYPYSITLQSDGSLLVADPGAGAIMKFNPDGVFLGNYGWGEPPQDITTDSTGNIYVLYSELYQVTKYNSNWGFLWSIGSRGSDDGQFLSPESLAVSGGYVFVTDSEKHSVQVFDADNGDYVTQFGSFGTGAGEFNLPTRITTDNAGNLLIADSYNGRIQKFSTDGTYLDSLGSIGFGNGELSVPAGIAVDAGGNIYVSDSYGGRIQKFDSSGVYQTQWGTPPNANQNGQLRIPLALAINPQNNQLAVTDTYNHQIQFFSLSGSFIKKIGAPGNGNGQFVSPNSLAYDFNGYLYVVDRGNHRIQKFNANGDYLAQWGSYGDLDGQFKMPVQIFIDRNNYIYVTDHYNHRVQKFSADGTFLMKFGAYGSGNGQFTYPWGIAVDSMGNIYVNDSTNRIQKFNSNGNFITVWGGEGSENGKFNSIYGMFIDNHDALWVADAWNHRIQVFAPNGDYLAKLSNSKAWNEIGRIYTPSSVALDSQNNIYIAEPNFNRVQKFSPIYYPYPNSVSLLNPDLTEYNKPIYRWKPTTNATHYYLEVNKSSRKLLTVYLEASNVCTSSMCSYQTNTTLTQGNYQYRVKAQFDNGLWGNYSAWQVFSVERPAPPAAPALQQPNGIINSNQPTYTWQQVAGASSYYLIVYSYNTGRIVLTQSGITNCSAGVCSFTQPDPLSPGYYGFKIRAANAYGWGTYSQWMNFRVLNQLLPVELLTPANGATGISLKPTFSWKAVTGATRYYLLVKDVNRNVYPVRRYIFCTSTTTCNFTLTTSLSSNTKYEYKIRAYTSSRGWGPYSESYQFTTQ